MAKCLVAGLRPGFRHPQARLAAFLKAITIHPLDDGRSVGLLIAQTSTSDAVDARLGPLISSRPDSIPQLAAAGRLSGMFPI
ncbi:MAG: hypothetical protein GY708_22600 [Actinomycetia bacterium]|nr:hypothetical protein [Actinomycetes bacterium]